MSYDNGTTGILDRNSNCGLIYMGWFKQVSYATLCAQWFSNGNADNLSVRVGNPASTQLQLEYSGINNGNSPFLTGSDGSWVFWCVVVTSGAGAVLYYRHEKVSTLSSVSIADVNQVGPGALSLINDGGFNAHVRMAVYKEWSNTNSLTLAQILAESTQKAPKVALGLVNYLPCDVGHTIGADQSTHGNDWTITTAGITINADEPIMTLSVQDAVFFSANF